jgi:uncharacterized protein (TIGR03067 family)
MRNRLLIAFLGVVPLLAAGASRGDDAKESFKKLSKGLQGTWVVESSTRDGKATGLKGSEVTFDTTASTMKLKQGKGEEEKSIWEVDLSKKPTGIGFRGKRKGSEFGRGVIELSGETLKLCLVPWGDEKPPTEFSDKGALLLVLKRKK